jgi:hypothetical protein
MACRISELVLKCRDPEVLARFWCEVLDFTELDLEDEVLIEIGPREGFGGPQPTIILIRDDEPKNEYCRLHRPALGRTRRPHHHPGQPSRPGHHGGQQGN